MFKFISLFLILISFNCNSEEKIITGKVFDDKNHPISFVSIGIIGTSYGTVSDEAGNFIFYLPTNYSKKPIV